MQHMMARTLLAVIPLLLVAASASSGAETSPSPEYKIKAMFLYHFAKFVEWPEGPQADSTGVVVGILGDDPFGVALDHALQQNTDQNVTVRRSNNLDDLMPCHILFIASKHQTSVERVLHRVQDKAVLTVGEQRWFTQRGGIVRFLIQNGRVRFEINVDAVKRAGIEVSAKLLTLAKIVPKDPAE